MIPLPSIPPPHTQHRHIAFTDITIYLAFCDSSADVLALILLPQVRDIMHCRYVGVHNDIIFRFHCGANPKYGLVETMPVWWPNEVFEWTALKNLSHRFEGTVYRI
jgi:hypothetical protein